MHPALGDWLTAFYEWTERHMTQPRARLTAGAVLREQGTQGFKNKLIYTTSSAPYSNKVNFQRGTFSCEVFMFFLCLCVFFQGSPASSHSSWTCMWGKLESLNHPEACLCVCEWFFVFLSLLLWNKVVTCPEWHPASAWIGSSRTPRPCSQKETASGNGWIMLAQVQSSQCKLTKNLQWFWAWPFK